MEKAVSSDAALEATGFGKFNYILILICGILSAGFFVELFALSVYLPASDCDLSLTSHQKGAVAGTELLGVVVGLYFWGLFGDVFGRRKSMIPAFIAVFLLDMITSVVNNYWPLIAVRFVHGFMISASCFLPTAYLGEFHTDSKRSKIIMSAIVVNGSFVLLADVIAWLVTSQTWQFYIPLLDIVYKPWRLHLIVNSLVMLASVGVLAFLPESPKFTLMQRKQDVTVATLHRMFRMNAGAEGVSYPYYIIYQEENVDQWIPNKKLSSISQRLQIMWYQIVPLFKRPVLKRTILLIVHQFLVGVSSRGLYVWHSTILNNVAEFRNENRENFTTICAIIRLKSAINSVPSEEGTKCKETLEMSTFLNNFILSILFIIATVGSLVLMKYFHKIYILAIFSTVTGLSGIVSAFVSIPTLATVLLVVMQSSIGAYGIYQILIIDSFPTHIRSMGTNVTFISASLAGSLSSNIIGALLETNYCEGVFVMCGCCLLLAGLLSLIIIPMERKNI